MYQEHPPDLRLTPFIETYWTADGFIENGKVSSKIFPDGCVDILFSFGDASAANGLQPFLPNIIGTTTTFIEVVYAGKIQMFGIRFKPAGITAFTRVPIHEFTNQRVDMTLVETLFDERFYDVLPEKIVETGHAPSLRYVRYVDNYLLNKLSHLYLPDKRILRAVHLIEQAHGQLSLADVASRVCLGQRHFERKFKSAVGISPKTFAKIEKFKNALHHLKTHDSLFSIAIDCGYYDQTHLIKDFKALTGDVPTHFR